MSELLSPRLMIMQKESMKAKEKLKTATLRAVSAAFKQILVDEKKESLNFEEEITVLKKMIKQRIDSATQFNAAGRKDLEEKELDEVSILSVFLPSQMSHESMVAEVQKVVDSFASKPTMKEMGMVMGKLSQFKAQADMGEMNKIVKQLLS